MKTFNDKNILMNIFAALVALIGIILLIVTWAYHIGSQWLIQRDRPKVYPADRDTWVIDPNYPNAICYYYCNVEATMINQLDLMRKEYDDNYCHID